ncbi:MAG: ribosome silencing factor [Candidatus Wallbacteria bacterium HGW-Wallbacteria-1]|jgi:ribosome-associated protein|uniref:Ribosomal silencing factor RsfS n=1 Tax=Candidatus Wallbacteria bacterium HGW-Wallbacteria-1 TaxID=2013854 RepID=A0A2N1PSJ6_9BACT|nr:MAG: ribosome silencing factor [Candidatus Wallbacteria bacterium HGW-Wallbacteria-1]
MLTEKIIAAAADKKAEEIMAVPVPAHLGIADTFVLCTAFSPPHMRAVVDGIEQIVHAALGKHPRHIEGDYTSDWVLMDYGDVVVHVMTPAGRSYYDLERLWKAFAMTRGESEKDENSTEDLIQDAPSAKADPAGE